MQCCNGVMQNFDAIQCDARMQECNAAMGYNTTMHCNDILPCNDAMRQCDCNNAVMQSCNAAMMWCNAVI
eukprot:398334-Rhodomonas_salina.1